MENKRPELSCRSICPLVRDDVVAQLADRLSKVPISEGGPRNTIEAVAWAIQIRSRPLPSSEKLGEWIPDLDLLFGDS